MRRHWPVVLVAMGALAVASAAVAAPPAPPRPCTAADAGTTVRSGSGSRRVLRFCGTARGVVQLEGVAYTISGGYCDASDAHLSIALGLVRTSAGPVSGGVLLVLAPGDRAGRVTVEDGEVQVPSRRLAVRGTAVVAKDRRSGTFTLVGVREPTLRVTGRWTCG